MHIFLILLTLSTQIGPPSNVRAFDTPNDAGQNITITWSSIKDIDGYLINRAEREQTFNSIASVTAFETRYIDGNAVTGKEYSYQVIAYKVSGTDTIRAYSQPSNYVKSYAHWFNTNRIKTLFKEFFYTTWIWPTANNTNCI